MAADPYWLTHESFDTHNFYATRLVRRKRRTEQQGDGTDAPGEEAGVRGNAGEAKGRGAAEEQAAGDKGGGANSEPNALGGLRRSMGEQQQQQQQDAGGRRGRAGKEEQERHGHGQRHGGGRAGGNGTAAGEAPPPPEEPQEDPRFPKFEVFQVRQGGRRAEGRGMLVGSTGRHVVRPVQPWLRNKRMTTPALGRSQGEEFMQAIAGDPLEAPGQLAGTVYYTGRWKRCLGVASSAKAVGRMGSGGHGRLPWECCSAAGLPARLQVVWWRCLSLWAVQVSRGASPTSPTAGAGTQRNVMPSCAYASPNDRHAACAPACTTRSVSAAPVAPAVAQRRAPTPALGGQGRNVHVLRWDQGRQNCRCHVVCSSYLVSDLTYPRTTSSPGEGHRPGCTRRPCPCPPPTRWACNVQLLACS